MTGINFDSALENATKAPVRWTGTESGQIVSQQQPAPQTAFWM